MQRRSFIKNVSLATGTLFAGKSMALPHFLNSMGSENATKTLTILHTNDVHSRLEPFPMDGGKYQGQGGIAMRKKWIDKIRAEQKNVLLLDAGDLFQGTPYFNMYHGEVEIKAMTMLKYDACTMGNHDFDGGVENFAKQLQYANFDVVVCNYDFTGTALEGLVKPYTIKRVGELKVGIIGVGIQLKGLVPDALCQGVEYQDPIENANKYAALLKQKYKCDMVICLSHLGYEYEHNKISDVSLAPQTKNIDLILGGHTHTFLKEPKRIKNAMGKEILINQVGWAGLQLGCINYDFFTEPQHKKLSNYHTAIQLKKTNIFS